MSTLARCCVVLLVAQGCWTFVSGNKDRRLILANVPSPSPSAFAGGSYGGNGGFGTPPSPYGSSTQVFSPPPPPPLPSSAQVTASPSVAAVLPAVKATQTLSAYSVATFDQAAQALFVSILETNIQKLSGSAVKVTINGFAAGSVVVDSTVTFLSGVASSAQAYQNAMTSGDTSSIFGTTFGTVSVDAASVQATTVANPASGAGSVAMRSLALAVATVALLVLSVG